MSVPTSLHVCLINLDRSPERLAEFRKINAHLSEDFTRLSAVDGRTLDLGVLQGAGLITSDILKTYSTNDLAWAMSHIALWKRGLASGDIITIAEDDAIFHQEFQRHAVEVIAECRHGFPEITVGMELRSVPVTGKCFQGCRSSGGIQEIKSMDAAGQFQSQRLQPFPLKLRWAFGSASAISVSPNGARRMMAKRLPLRPQVYLFPEGLRRSRMRPTSGRSASTWHSAVSIQNSTRLSVFLLIVITRNDQNESTKVPTR